MGLETPAIFHLMFTEHYSTQLLVR